MIVGNRVYSNNNIKTPAIDIAVTAEGNGILVAGGNDDVVEHNLVYDQSEYGIGVIPLPEKVLAPSDPKSQNFEPSNNTVRDNDVSGSKVADLRARALHQSEGPGEELLLEQRLRHDVTPRISNSWCPAVGRHRRRSLLTSPHSPSSSWATSRRK